MILRRGLAMLGLALPLLAQYSGPAILSRGEAPSPFSLPQINFRPYAELNGVYDTGLAGAVTNDQGQIASTASEGIELVAGVSGMHSWRHTKVGVDYRGSYRHYSRRTYFDGADQQIMLGVVHQLTRHMTLTLRESGGVYSRDFGLLGTPQTLPYDPNQTYIPRTDFFDNRTFFINTQADFTIQMSNRLSFDIGGDGFLVRRRSSALYGATGANARGDVQYRLSRRSTIGLVYSFNHFDYLKVYGAAEVHALAASYSVRASRRVEFSANAGVARLEAKFVQSVAVDPVITALLGITSASQLVYNTRYLPSGNLRLAYLLQHGSLYIGAGRSVNPGNGLFLTSAMYNVNGGYNYTGFRHWDIGVLASYDNSTSYGNIQGRYHGSSGGFRVSRQIARSVHALVSVDARRYGSPNYTGYNRTIYNARIGIAFAPGDIPLRVW